MTRHIQRSTLLMALAVSAATALSGCARDKSPEPVAESAADRAAAETAMRAVDSALQAAIVAKDAGRTASFYAADATLLPVAEQIVTGREAIEREWAKVFGIPGFVNRARITNVKVARGRDMAYTQGTYETAMTAPDGKPTTERGKWVSVWRRDPDGAWRIVADIFNTDSPPPAHQESTTGEHSRPKT